MAKSIVRILESDIGANMTEGKDIDMVSKKEFREYTDKFDKFLEQYELDMRGNKDLSNGNRGVIGELRSLKETQDDYPSLTWLLAHKPLPTLAIIIGSFLVLYGSIVLGTIKIVTPLIGVDLSSVPDTH